jgi:hypothetical protein
MRGANARRLPSDGSRPHRIFALMRGSTLDFRRPSQTAVASSPCRCRFYENQHVRQPAEVGGTAGIAPGTGARST